MIGFSVFRDAAENLATIKRFVETGQGERLLSEFGEVELEAAKLALSSANIARNPAQEVQGAVTHLQSAHVALKRTYSTKKFITLPDEAKAANTDIWVCCLMAVCYRYLGEDQLVQSCLDMAQQAMRVVHVPVFGKGGVIMRMTTIKYYKQAGAVWLRPAHHAKGIVNSLFYVSKRQLKSFRSAMTKG
jgi:hypothetical protein